MTSAKPNLANLDLHSQISALLEIVKKNEPVFHVINTAAEIGLPNWYVGAGCIVQSVWNHLSELPISQNIKDIDLVYFDATDLSEEKENQWVQKVREKYSAIDLHFDVKNQARVHTWYEKSFGFKIKPYSSTEDAINSWPTLATCTAIRKQDDQYKIYAPYGLNDVLGLICRPNKTQITRDVYEKKIDRWQTCWPQLTVFDWDETNERRLVES